MGCFFAPFAPVSIFFPGAVESSAIDLLGMQGQMRAYGQWKVSLG